jgi:hypothetical protein
MIRIRTVQTKWTIQDANVLHCIYISFLYRQTSCFKCLKHIESFVHMLTAITDAKYVHVMNISISVELCWVCIITDQQ